MAPVNVINITTSSLHIGLRESTMTIEYLSPFSSHNFSFASSSTTPQNRTGPLHQHLGDITFRVLEKNGSYVTYSTAAADGTVPLPHINVPGELAAVDLTPSLPGSPLSVERHYLEDKETGDLLLRHDFKMNEVHGILSKNETSLLEIGSLGISMVFDQLFTGR